MISNAGVPNMTAEIAAADAYPLIRLFTVGQLQANNVSEPQLQLNEIRQPWMPASSASVGFGAWQAFSAVCWFTFRQVFNSLGGKVPLGLISNNWGMPSSHPT